MATKEELNDKLLEYLKVREKLTNRRTRQYEVKAIIDKLNDYLETNEEKLYCLQASIDNEWLWVFPENTAGIDLDDLRELF